MKEMYEYLEEHAYISKNKKSNYQFELSKERAECIANKYNSLVEEKDKEIERLNNIIQGIDDIIKNHYIFGHTIQNGSLDSILKEIQELKENK